MRSVYFMSSNILYNFFEFEVFERLHCHGNIEIVRTQNSIAARMSLSTQEILRPNFRRITIR